MSGFSLAMVVAFAVVVGTAVVAIIGVLIDRSASHYDRRGGMQ
jgi:hypothetical protein